MDHHSEAIVEVTSSIEYAPSIPCETVAVMYSMGLLYTIAGIATIFFYDPKDEAIRSPHMFRRLINSFGGGILLAITCFYLIPEVFENFSKLKDSTLAKSITPYPMLFICVGFFLFYLIKQIVYISIEPSNQLTAQLRTEQIIQSLMGYDPAEKFKAQVLVSAKGLMLVCSLSSNEFYEKVNWRYCATLGSQWVMFLMVAAYKFFIVFFIATELLLMGCGFWLACTFIVIYSLVIPVLQKDSNLSPAYETNAMPICVQQALATGTLLYVVVFEILRKQQYKIITVTMTFLGVLTMTLIQLFVLN